MNAMGWMALLMMAAAISRAPAAAGAEVFDPAVETYRQCLSSFEEPGQVSKSTGVVVIGASRPNPGKPKQPKLGVYSITPGGIVYFHECEPGGALLTYPSKLTPAQQDYALPAKTTLAVKNVSVDPKKYPESWKLEAVPGGAPRCEGARVKTPAILNGVRKRIETRIKAEGAKFSESRLVDEATTQLKKVHPERGVSKGRATTYSFTNAEMREEKLRLLDLKLKPLLDCRDGLATLKPAPSAEERRLIAKIGEPISVLEKAKAKLKQEGAAGGDPSGPGAAGGAR